MSDKPLRKCKVCGLETPPASFDEFVNDSKGRHGKANLCKHCKSERERVWAETHSEQKRARAHAYYEAHLEQKREYGRAWYETHKEQAYNQLRAWRAAHPEQTREIDRAWNAAHPEERRQRSRKWYMTHLEQARAHDRAYNATHREQAREYARLYKAAHPDQVREATQAWRKANLDWTLEYSRKWRAAHPDQAREWGKKRRAILRGAEGMYTESDFWSLCERLGWICVGCGRSLTKETAERDHIVALVKGGSNDISNIQPLCKSCNSRKGTKDMTELVGAEWAWTNWVVKEL